MKRNTIKLRTIIPLLLVFLALGLILPLFGSVSSDTAGNTPVTKLPSEDGGMNGSQLPSAGVGNNLTGHKFISYLGDSITTYEGWSNNDWYNSSIGENSVYYDETKLDVTQTWWYQLTSQLGMNLCVNNSWNGGRVTEKAGTVSGVHRASDLDRDYQNILPDVIVVYMGTNDVANGVALEEFETAYSNMLNEIKEAYPDAEVYTCTILPESRTVNKKTEVANYNESIRSITKSYGYEVIDFAAELTDWDYMNLTFVDGTLRVHPTVEGMDKLTACAYEVIK